MSAAVTGDRFPDLRRNDLRVGSTQGGLFVDPTACGFGRVGRSLGGSAGFSRRFPRVGQAHRSESPSGVR